MANCKTCGGAKSNNTLSVRDYGGKQTTQQTKVITLSDGTKITIG